MTRMSGKLKTKRAGHQGVLTKFLRKTERHPEELIQQYNVNELSTLRNLIQKLQNNIKFQRQDY